MNFKDTVSSAIEASISSELGDIEIADDVQKTSAWLVALSTAALYFSFVHPATLPKNTSTVIQYTLAGASCFFLLSSVAAFFVRDHYTRFRAYSRNLIVGRKMLLSLLLQNEAEVSNALLKAKTPLWAAIHTSTIQELIPEIPLVNMQNVVQHQLTERARLDSVFTFQKLTAVIGFVAFTICLGYEVYGRLAT